MSVISGNKSENSAVSSYATLHEAYTRKLLNGRHPRSFPRQSELWAHYRASNKRLDRIERGHRLWHVVENQDAADADWDEDFRDEGSADIRLESADSHSTSGFGLKDLGVDLDASVRLHYGMVIVIVNSNEELVCVNEFNETLVKKLDDMTPLDHFLFKLVDLGDPTYPGPLVYSRPVWLQIFKRVAADNSLQFGQLIGGKLFAPPAMTSAQLAEKEKIDASKREARDRLDRSVMVGSNPLKGAPDNDQHQVAGPLSSHSRNETFALGDESDDEPSSNPHARSYRGSRGSGPGTGNGQEQPDVCGGISVINIMGGKSDGRDRTDEAGARHRTRSSWHLGQWVVRNAARKEVSDGRAKRGATVMSDANIYLEQDLYCLSSSAGSDFQPWPRRAHSPHSERYRKKAERMNPAKSEKDLSNTMHASRIELPSMGKEIAKLSDTLAPLDLNYISMSNSTRPGTPDSGLTSLSSVTVVAVPKKHVGQKSEIYSYGCLRKVVLRGPPYQLVVDRRCVWKLCPANNFGDTNELSAKEKVAHKLLRSAEEGLEASKQNREGGRVYDKVVLDGQPLHGGEKFSRNLRSILSQHGFKKETQQLNLRRKQEKLIESHFHGLYESGNGWPEGGKFPSPLPKPSRLSPPVSPLGRHAAPDSSVSGETFITSANPIPQLEKSGGRQHSKGILKAKDSKLDLSVKEDATYGVHMLKLHRSLHAANVRLVNALSSPNPPATPFSATFGYAGDIVSAAIVPTSVGQKGALTRVRNESFSGNMNTLGTSRDNNAVAGVIEAHARQPRLGDKSGASGIETALAMGRLAKRLEKLKDVDEVVHQALRHRERIEKYGRIAAVFKNLASTDTKSSKFQDNISTSQFIPDINIDGYDPSCAT